MLWGQGVALFATEIACATLPGLTSFEKHIGTSLQESQTPLDDPVENHDLALYG